MINEYRIIPKKSYSTLLILIIDMSQFNLKYRISLRKSIKSIIIKVNNLEIIEMQCITDYANKEIILRDYIKN